MVLFEGLQSYGLLLLRLAIGSIFLYHGSHKLAAWKKTPNFFRFLGIAETLGGLATIAGFLTQLANIGFAIIMLGALYHKIYKWHIAFSAEQTSGWEFDLILLGAALALATLGAGSFSIDALAGFYP